MKSMIRLFAVMAIAIFSALGASAQLPSAHLQDLDGNPVDASTLGNDGKPFIIDFWATWCKPCIRELKAIHEVYPDWVEETGVKVYAISVDTGQDIQKVRPMVNAREWEYEVLVDPTGEFQRAMGVQNPPHTFIVDGNGNIVESHPGYTEGSEESLIEKVRELLGK